MTLLSVVRDVCAVVGVLQPQSVFSSITENRTMQEMLALANEMAQRIAYDTRDWTMLKKTQIYVGDAALVPPDPPLLPTDPPQVLTGTTAFDLPVDYKRMLFTSSVWRTSSTQQAMKFIPDTDQWMHRRARNEAGSAWGEWTIIGGQMHIYAPMAVGVSAYFAYLDKNCIALNSGGVGDVFTSDLDAFRLDERVLKLGMIWQWKAQKGSAYAEDLGTYGDALTNAMGHDSPAPIIVGDYRERSYARFNQ